MKKVKKKLTKAEDGMGMSPRANRLNTKAENLMKKAQNRWQMAEDIRKGREDT